MLCNLWHIKQTNGLYYYALDYLRAINPRIPVLVRPALFDAIQRALPYHQVHAVSARGLVMQLIGAAIQGRWVFTPTSHPFPLLKRQLIVIHDDYPFLGPHGWFKRMLFHALLTMSRCHVGHINHSTALHAITDDVVPAARRWYMPNLGPLDSDIEALRRLRTERTTVAGNNSKLRVVLFGTDSRKKRYEVLFKTVRFAGLSDRFLFYIYGHPTPYLEGLKNSFPELLIELIESSETSMEVILGSSDCIASVAEHEGFGRPFALALAADMPCFLLQSPAFEEFFGRSTKLYPSVETLVAALASNVCKTSTTAARYASEFIELTQIRQAFCAATDRLSLIAAGAKGRP